MVRVCRKGEIKAGQESSWSPGWEDVMTALEPALIFPEDRRLIRKGFDLHKQQDQRLV